VSSSQTAAVAGLSGSAVGALDLSGNVYEWVDDWCGAVLPAGFAVQGPASGSDRVFRGGSWRADPQYARVADRYVGVPGLRGSGLGVRLLRAAP